MQNKDLSYAEALQKVRIQARKMLDRCNHDQTPTICRLLSVEGNRELFVEKIVDMAKDGIPSDEAIAILERRYNPNLIDE
jgi:hypothetical protein